VYPVHPIYYIYPVSTVHDVYPVYPVYYVYQIHPVLLCIVSSESSVSCVLCVFSVSCVSHITVYCIQCIMCIQGVNNLIQSMYVNICPMHVFACIYRTHIKNVSCTQGPSQSTYIVTYFYCSINSFKLLRLFIQNKYTVPSPWIPNLLYKLAMNSECYI